MPFLEDSSFNKFHIRPIELDTFEVDEQQTNTDQYFPDNGIGGYKIESLSVAKLTAGSIRVDEYIQSTGFVSGSTGWQIKGDGTAEFVGITLSGGVFRYGKTAFTDAINAGYYFGSEGMYVGSALDATLLKFTIATGAIDHIGTISSRSTATIASAINVSGNLITDIVNARLNSSTKSILSDFEFDSVDYSGGIKCGTITWNATTGAITGGSGGVFHKGGLLFSNAGVATITLDATTGNATFGGTLVAAAGTLGSITAGTFTGITIAIGTGDNIFKANSNGIYLGDATFADAPFRVSMAGALTATSATISGGATGGWTITSTTIQDTAGLVGMSSAVTAGDDIRFWAGHVTPASAPFRVTEAGVVNMTSAIVGNWTVNATSIYTGTEDHSGYTANAGDITLYSDGSDASIHAKNWYIDTAGVLNCTAAVVSGAITTTASSVLDGGYLSANTVASASANLALRGWTITCAFSATDSDTVAWGAGTFTASDGTAYAIGAGNTGNMAARTYIYLDIAVSTIALQTTTTATTAIGNGKVLIGVAENNTDATSDATFQIFGGIGGQSILVDYIAANSASTNEFVSNTAQIANLIVTSAKISDLVANKITAGTGIINNLEVKAQIKAGSVVVLHNCDTYNGNGTWLAAYDAESIATDATEYLEGSGSIKFNIDVSNGAENYGEIYVPDMATVDLSAYEDIGVFRLWIFLPSVLYITQINLNWGDAGGADGWTNTATTQANGDAFVSGWNQVEFDWDGAGTFGTGDPSAVGYLAVRLTYGAGQTDMTDCRIDYIACYDPRGSFRSYASGNKGGMLMNYFGIEGYNLKNVRTTEINAETGKITARDIVVTAKAGSNIWSPITLTGYFAGMDNTTYSTQCLSLNTDEDLNGDIALVGYTSTSAISRVARWKQLSSTATPAIALYNSNTSGNFAGGADNHYGIIKIGSYFYDSWYDAAGGGASMSRLTEDLSTAAACSFSGTSGHGSLAYDNANSYLLILDGTTSVKRYTISGTTITYVDTITLSTGLTSRTPAFMYDGDYYWGYSAGTMRKYDKLGTQSGNLSIGETDTNIIKGLIKLQGILYLAIEAPEKLENNGYIKQQYIVQLVPINNF